MELYQISQIAKNDLIYTVKEPKKAKTRRNIRCPFCNRKVKTKKGLKQHIRIKHPKTKKNKKLKKPTKSTIIAQTTVPPLSNVIIVDENLNYTSSLVRQLGIQQNKAVSPLPSKLRGQCDEMILKFLISHKCGLVTQDKMFAIQASKRISNVFLFSHDFLIKMERVL
jgi:hypothetical protein